MAKIALSVEFQGFFHEISPSEKYFSDSGKWPFHTPPIHTPTKCRPRKKKKSITTRSLSCSRLAGDQVFRVKTRGRCIRSAYEAFQGLSGSHRSTRIASDLASRGIRGRSHRKPNHSESPNRRRRGCRFFASQANIARLSQGFLCYFSCDFRSS